MTKEQLKKYRGWKQNIGILEKEISNMLGETVHDFGHDYSKGFKKVVHLDGFNQELYERRLKKLSELEARIRKVESWIESIEDDRLRFVIRSRYTEDRTWRWIARKLGNVSEEYVRIVIHDRSFEKK
ncbi:hypothetical protein [Oribacterium sinus]|jgi:hypothetical protein|uniref:Phage transcriptional regulator, RinA family n=1 Tax=Oribacterium sinus F0268 TaxID=585501 RepID=C2KWH6_9FIRM|nr:hypothetical protein [Oribacterium sinus]EEJ51865.1 hypothetical protein HMPREF6123_0845 [Oribacterium sinus F0268]DAO99812.1 MAG TPA: Protein of unknown function (DUF722) [Caudoviricetes sp.]DAY27107.1 MAG TPA: Protein of unknown function (DUF722) [Caudoviricetes sp.]